MRTRYVDDYLLAPPDRALDPVSRRLLRGEALQAWSVVDRDQHVLVAYLPAGRVPIAIARLRRHDGRAEIACRIAAPAYEHAAELLIRELAGIARAAGLLVPAGATVSVVSDHEGSKRGASGWLPLDVHGV